MVMNNSNWSAIQQAIPIFTEQPNFYGLESTVAALPSEPYIFQPSWPSEVIPAVVVQEQFPAVLDNAWSQQSKILPSGRSSSQSSKFASPQLKSWSRQNGNEMPLLRTPKSDAMDMDRLRPSKSVESPNTLQREIELAAARTRISMLEKIFFPESFAYFKKQDRERESAVAKKEEAEDANQKEEGIQCRMSFDEVKIKETSASRKSERSDLLPVPHVPVYPRDSSMTPPSSGHPDHIAGSGIARTQGLSPPSMRPTYKTVELIRTVAPGKDPAQGAGIGLIFQQTRLTNKLIVSGLTAGGSAALSGKVGIGDVIHAIDGRPVLGRSIREVVALIKGQEGSRVVLSLQDYQSNVRRVVLLREPVPGREMAPGQAVGVGVAIQASRSTRAIIVVSVAPGSSADRSGAVSPGDIVHAVDGTAVQGFPISEVVGRIKGAAGTEVILHLESTGAIPSKVPSSPGIHNHSTGSSPDAAGFEPPIVHEDKSEGQLGVLSQQQLGSAPNFATDAAASPAAGRPSAGGIKRVVLLRRAFHPMASAASGGGVVLGGIGMSFVVSEGRHIVSMLAPNGTAQASGQVEVGDIILSVNDVPAQGKSVKELVGEIVGPENTEVVVVLQSGAQS